MTETQADLYDPIERQFNFVQTLKKLDFYNSKNFKSLEEATEFNLDSTTKSHTTFTETTFEEEDTFGTTRTANYSNEFCFLMFILLHNK